MTSSFVASAPRLADARPRTVAPVRSTRQVCRAQSVKSDAHNLNQLISTTPFDGYKFAPIRESTVNRAMTSRYFKDMHDYAEADVVITGAGSAGLACAYELTKYPDVKVSVTAQTCLPVGLAAAIFQHLEGHTQHVEICSFLLMKILHGQSVALHNDCQTS